jgi:hypothetical protein
MMKLQHQSIDCSTIMESLKYKWELRQAYTDCIAKLEEAILQKTIKNKSETSLTWIETGRIDLQRFWSLDGPLFSGPFQDVEWFIT